MRLNHKLSLVVLSLLVVTLLSSSVVLGSTVGICCSPTRSLVLVSGSPLLSQSQCTVQNSLNSFTEVNPDIMFVQATGGPDALKNAIINSGICNAVAPERPGQVDPQCASDKKAPANLVVSVVSGKRAFSLSWSGNGCTPTQFKITRKAFTDMV